MTTVTHQYMVAFGAPFEGYSFYGPFETMEDAQEYAEGCNSSFSWWIVELETP